MRGSQAPVRQVVLLGLMGSGKTTVGRLVAGRLGWPLRDSDADIEALEGRTGRELRETLGTAALHALEAAHLMGALAGPGPAVICAAASTVEDPACLAALRDPSVLAVWLVTSPATAAARFGDQAHRPRYGDDPAVFLARQGAERAAGFRAAATVELATDGVAPADLAGRVLALLESRA